MGRNCGPGSACWERERERERERENALLHNVGILVLIFSSSLLWSFLCSRGPSLFVVESMQIIFFCPAFSVSVFVAYVRRLQLHPEIWHWCNALRRLVCTAMFKCSGFFLFYFLNNCLIKCVCVWFYLCSHQLEFTHTFWSFAFYCSVTVLLLQLIQVQFLYKLCVKFNVKLSREPFEIWTLLSLSLLGTEAALLGDLFVQHSKTLPCSCCQ